MTFKKYSQYRVEEEQWFGSVPQHWGVIRARRFFTQKRESARIDDEQLSATQKYGVIPQKKFMELEDQKVTLALNGLESFKHIEIDDFVISLRSFQGGIERSLYSGCVSPAYTVLRCSQPIDPRYWGYLFKCSEFIAALQSVTDGIRDGKSISYEQFGSLALPLPKISEQSNIATFLDQETKKVDVLLEENEILISLLKEKRKEIISKAVTNGHSINKSSETTIKNWVESVPENWKIGAIKYFCTKITDGAHISPDIQDGAYYFVSTKDIRNSAIDFEGSLLTSKSSFDYLVRTGCKPYIGDVLFSKDGTIGNTVVVRDEREFVVASSLIIIRPNSKILNSEYLNYVCQSSLFMNQVEGFVKGAGLPRLSIQNLQKVRCVVPPLDEQSSIVKFLDAETNKIDHLLSNALRAIELLKERRKALISAAVTGKIDVSGLASRGVTA